MQIHPNKNDLSQIVEIEHNDLIGIHFGSDWNKLKIAPNLFCEFLFSDNPHQILDANLPKKINTINNGFCGSMFINSQIEKIPDNFSLPNTLCVNGSYVMNGMFKGCTKLVNTNNFSLPKKLTYDGDRLPKWFCSAMFEGCTSLVELSNNFHTPNVFGTKDYPIRRNFYSEMFKGCTELQTISKNFFIPSVVSKEPEQQCLYGLFQNCSSLKWDDSNNKNLITMPRGINENGEDISIDFTNIFDGATNILQHNGDKSSLVSGDQVYIARTK